VNEVLEYIGLLPKAHSLPSRLSGGEKQRVAIARALVTTPTVLLADEPTANLDWDNTLKVINMFHSIRRDFHTTILVVTHDLRLLDFFDRALYMFENTLKPLTGLSK